MRRVVLVVGILAAWGSASAQPKVVQVPSTTLVEPPTPLFPQQAGALNLVGSVTHPGREANSTTIFAANCFPAAADATVAGDASRCVQILNEDGLSRFAVGRYQGASGPQVEFWAEQFGDATGAFSAYTYYRSLMSGARPVSPKIDAANDAVASGEGTLVWAGTSLLHSAGGSASKSEIAAIVAALPKVGGRKGLAPLLPTYLPAEAAGARIDRGSVRYALGPVGYQAMGGVLPAGILSWEKSAEAATAAYAGRGGKGTFTLLLYPTPQIAGDRGRAIEKAVNEAGAGSFGTVKMRRLGPLVGMTSGGLSTEQAQQMVAAMHLNEEVTFDQKMPLEFHAEIRKTATLLQNIAIFSGILIVAAILLGLFLGGARAGIRVLQGKPAHSEPEFLTINLRDKPKALFANRDRGVDGPAS